MNLAQHVDTLNLLGDESRIRLCALLRQRELCVNDLVRVTGISQSRVSTHLGRLREAGFVRDRRQGRAVLLRARHRHPARHGAAILDEAASSTIPTLDGDQQRLLELDAERRGGLPESFVGRDRARLLAGAHLAVARRRARGAAPAGRRARRRLGRRRGGELARALLPLADLHRHEPAHDRGGDASGWPRYAARPRAGRRRSRASVSRRRRSTRSLVFHTLTYAEHPARALAECARVLRPGGRLVLLCLDQHEQREVTAPLRRAPPGLLAARAPRPALARRASTSSSAEVACREAKKPHLQVVLAIADKLKRPSKNAKAADHGPIRILTRSRSCSQNRIAIIDGAMGTTIRTYGMKEADIRGERFKDSKKDLLNNGDLFSLTQPEMICDIHRRFLEAGADIIETNTFGATSITQSEFFVDDPREHGGRKDPAFYQKIIEDQFLDDLAWEINEQSARQCREWADRVANADGAPALRGGRDRAATVSLSNSPDADDAGFRVVTFDQVKAAYVQQVRALIAGGVDVLLVETIFDSLNAKAALVAIRGGVRRRTASELPVMISAAVGRGGETMISAQTIEAFWNAVEHVKPLSVGLNCSLGPGPDVSVPRRSSRRSPARAISCYPNAGLPNPLSPTGFDLEPPDMARYLGEFARRRPLNIAGGCCGNTPEHIAAIAKALDGRAAARARRATGEAPSVPASVASRVGRAPPAPAAPVGLAAVHAAAGRLHDDRRAHQRRRLAQVRQARSRKANTKRRSASRASRSRTAPTSSTSAWTRG